MASSETWTDPNRCPFCGGQLPSPGAGFVGHVEENPDCRSEFRTWRERVSDDVRGGWTG